MVSTFNFADHVFAVSLDKEVDSKTLNNIKKMIEERLETIECVNLYFEIQNEHGMTFPAVLKDLAFHFKHAGDFGRIAVVTEKESLQKLMEMKDLFLNSEIRAFENEERIDAMNWVMNKFSENTLDK